MNGILIILKWNEMIMNIRFEKNKNKSSLWESKIGKIELLQRNYYCNNKINDSFFNSSLESLEIEIAWFGLVWFDYF